jgi:hypothetical protein
MSIVRNILYLARLSLLLHKLEVVGYAIRRYSVRLVAPTERDTDYARQRFWT